MRWFRSLDRATQWAILVWVGIVVGVCGRVIVASPRSHTVYPIYVTAAQKFHVGEDLYGLLAPELDVWRYHPVIAAGFVPWAELPEKLGGVLWRLANLGVFLAGLFAFHRTVLLPRISLAWLLLLAAPLCLHSFNNAQANVLLLGLLMLSVAAFAVERWWLAAAFLASAVLLKGYPIALALLLMVYAPKRFGLKFVALMLVGCVLPFGLQSAEYVGWQYARWFEVMQLDDRLGASLERCTRDVYMICRVWIAEPSRFAYRFVQLGSAGLLAFACWRKRSHPDRLRFAFDGACLWMTLLGPATEACTYTLLATTFATTVLSRPLSPILAMSVALFLYTTFAGAFPKAWRFENAALAPIAGMLLAWAALRPSISRDDRENRQVPIRALVEVV